VQNSIIFVTAAVRAQELKKNACSVSLKIIWSRNLWSFCFFIDAICFTVEVSDTTGDDQRTKERYQKAILNIFIH